MAVQEASKLTNEKAEAANKIIYRALALLTERNIDINTVLTSGGSNLLNAAITEETTNHTLISILCM